MTTPHQTPAEKQQQAQQSKPDQKTPRDGIDPVDKVAEDRIQEEIDDNAKAAH